MRRYLGILIIIVLSLFLVRSIFIDGFYPMHDNTQITRVFEMEQSLNDGMIPVRWVRDLGYGYGYPIFSFYAPLAYYVGGFIALFGVGAVLATKLMIAMGTILAGITMYFLARTFWGEKGGILAGILYTYAPYHAVNLYVRGAIAELWAYAFLPLVFYGLWMTYSKRSWKYVVIGSVAYGAVILSHNLTALMLTPFLLISVLVLLIVDYQKRKKISFLLCLPIICGLLLSSFYFLPAVMEMGYTNVRSQIGGGSAYYDHFVCSSQLWSSPWGFGGSVPGCLDGISLQLGKIHILLFGLAFISLFFYRKYSATREVLFFSLISGIIAVFLMLGLSKSIWELAKVMEYLQFPWRFSAFFLLFSSFAAGAVIPAVMRLIKPAKVNYLIGIFMLLLFLAAIFSLYSKHFKPQTIIHNESLAIDSNYIRTQVSRISDEYLPSNFVKPSLGQGVSERVPARNGVRVKKYVDKTQYVEADITMTAATQYYFNIAAFPSWKIFVDGMKKEVLVRDGRVGVSLEQGTSRVVVRFEQTLVQKIGNALSVSGILLLGVGIIYKRKKSNGK